MNRYLTIKLLEGLGVIIPDIPIFIKDSSHHVETYFIDKWGDLRDINDNIIDVDEVLTGKYARLRHQNDWTKCSDIFKNT